MKERRKFLRFDTALGAICDIIKEKTKARSRIKNISKEGALIVVDKRLAEGSEINLTMDVPGDNIPILAKCEVAWQKGSGSEKYETGVRFTKIDGSDKGRLREYIYAQWLRFLDRK
jgi:c-di-GMP-binding flagellar brake protein YcgR